MKPSKCMWASPKVRYLGHVLSAHGVAIDEGKIRAIMEFPVPTTISELRRFFFMCNHYRKFIKGFATVAAPISDQLKHQQCGVKWTEPAEACFTELKKRLSSSPILGFPDFEQPFTIQTDASNVGIGAVLIQFDDQKQQRVISYASRVLDDRERKY